MQHKQLLSPRVLGAPLTWDRRPRLWLCWWQALSGIWTFLGGAYAMLVLQRQDSCVALILS